MKRNTAKIVFPILAVAGLGLIAIVSFLMFVLFAYGGTLWPSTLYLVFGFIIYLSAVAIIMYGIVKGRKNFVVIAFSIAAIIIFLYYSIGFVVMVFVQDAIDDYEGRRYSESVREY